MEHFNAGLDTRLQPMLEDARRVVRLQFAGHCPGESPHLPAHTLLAGREVRQLAQAYHQASRDRRTYLLIAPVSVLLLSLNECRQLAPLFQAGLADYLALTALYHPEPRYWPVNWEAQVNAQPAQMVARLAGAIPALRSVAPVCFLCSGPWRMREIINAHLRSENAFDAVHACFGLRAGLAPRRLAGLLQGSIALDDHNPSGKR